MLLAIVRKNGLYMYGTLHYVKFKAMSMKNLSRIVLSIAAIGSAVSAFTGGIEGFLAGLGFSVGAKFLDVEIEGLSEKLAKFFTRSYQANVYEFKKEYKGKIRT